uniref:(northern house mosquito) hypothetical protein n=1 Tax=Culex pipiens TaxID=7175 RepID=A0A8D8H404_CULPI
MRRIKLHDFGWRVSLRCNFASLSGSQVLRWPHPMIIFGKFLEPLLRHIKLHVFNRGMYNLCPHPKSRSLIRRMTGLRCFLMRFRMWPPEIGGTGSDGSYGI